MMKFPLLKMLHYRVIVGKLLSTIQMTEVSKLFLQKNTSMVRSSFRSGYTSKSSHTFGPDFCSFYSKFCLNRHLYKSDYNYKLKTEMSVAVRSKERWQILWLGQNWMYFYLSQLWFTVQFVFMIHFFLVLPDTSFVVSAKKVLESGIACAYLFFFCRKTQWTALVCKKRPSNGNSLSLEMKTYKHKLQLLRRFGKNALLKYQWVANGVSSFCHTQFLIKYRK